MNFSLASGMQQVPGLKLVKVRSMGAIYMCFCFENWDTGALTDPG